MQGAVPPLDVTGLARALASAAVDAPWKHFIVGQPGVDARGAAAVIRRDAFAPCAGPVGGTIPDKVGNDPAELATKGGPHPAGGVEPAAHEAPAFIEFEPVARRGM